MIYRGDRLPKELQGNAFVVDSPTNLVHRLVDQRRWQRDGSRRRTRTRKGEFLASTDERFRPVNLFSAPDGTIYIVDMYRGVVQDVQFQTDYLKDYIVKHQLEQPVGNGRIWRVVHDIDAVVTRSRRFPRRRRPISWRSCRIPTAGGATRRSSCWCSAGTSRWCRP